MHTLWSSIVSMRRRPHPHLMHPPTPYRCLCWWLCSSAHPLVIHYSNARTATLTFAVSSYALMAPLSMAAFEQVPTDPQLSSGADVDVPAQAHHIPACAGGTFLEFWLRVAREVSKWTRRFNKNHDYVCPHFQQEYCCVFSCDRFRSTTKADMTKTLSKGQIQYGPCCKTNPKMLTICLF